MASQTMRNRCKQRVVRSKGGLDRGLNDPNLSGAYIRSLVKQLTSSRNQASLKSEVPTSTTSSHGIQPALPMVDTGKIADHVTTHLSTQSKKPQESSNCTHKPEIRSNPPHSVSVPPPPPPPQQKKQARRRPHTRKTSQDCPLNIAEARREIVTALHLHRAATGGAAAASKIPPARNQKDQKPRSNNYNSPGIHNTTAYNQSQFSGNIITPAATRCNSWMSKGASGAHKGYCEPKAITKCGHFLCWPCLSEYLLCLSSWTVKDCLECGKPLTANDIFPITLGVPIVHQSTVATCAGLSTSILQSSPLLLTNSLPVPQPAWSTAGPSLIPVDGISSTASPGGLNIMEYNNDEAVTPAFTMASDNPSNVAFLNPKHEDSIKGNWHPAMDEAEMAQIRSLGEQHEMEWSDSVDLATSTWWFKFFSQSDLDPDMNLLDFEENDYDSLQNILEQPGLVEDPLNTMNEDPYVGSELNPVESLWHDEWFDYHDWIEDHKNWDLYNETESSQPLKNNKSGCDQYFSDETNDLHSELTSDFPDNNWEVSVGDKRKRDWGNT